MNDDDIIEVDGAKFMRRFGDWYAEGVRGTFDVWPTGGDAQLCLDEIERLRAEKENLRVALAIKDSHDHFDCTAERELLRLRVERLQGLIDAYAEAVVALGADDRSATSAEWAAWIAASDALIAAATKEDDRA